MLPVGKFFQKSDYPILKKHKKGLSIFISMPNLIWLSACGENKVGQTEGTSFVGLIETYKPPIPEHTVIEIEDPHFKKLEQVIASILDLALEMSRGEVVSTILRYENTINFSFPLFSMKFQLVILLLGCLQMKG